MFVYYIIKSCRSSTLSIDLSVKRGGAIGAGECQGHLVSGEFSGYVAACYVQYFFKLINLSKQTNNKLLTLAKYIALHSGF